MVEWVVDDVIEAKARSMTSCSAEFGLGIIVIILLVIKI